MQPSPICRRASWRSFSHEQPQTKLRPRLPSLSGCVQMDRKLIWFFTCKKRVSVESARVPKWIWSISFFRGFEDGKWVSSIGLWRHGLTMKWDFTALAVRRRPQPFLLCSSSRTEEVTVQLRDSWSGFSVATRQKTCQNIWRAACLRMQYARSLSNLWNSNWTSVKLLQVNIPAVAVSCQLGGACRLRREIEAVTLIVCFRGNQQERLFHWLDCFLFTTWTVQFMSAS